MHMRVNPDRPLVGVGAVILEKGKILLIKRGSEPNKGLWSIPGGPVRIGETLREALRREVREETGLEVEVNELAFVADEILEFEGARYHYVIVDFFANIKGGELKPGSDAVDARWFNLQEMEKEDVVDFVRKIAEEVKVGRKGIYLH